MKNINLLDKMNIEKLSNKIEEFIVKNDSDIENEFITKRYVEPKDEINIRILAEKYGISMKKVGQKIEKVERKLYIFLSQQI